jgi:MSHA biogenesis protein MshP
MIPTRRQRGLGLITVIVVLVLLAVLAGGMVALSSTQSTTQSQDVLAARAEQAARAGVDWGLYQAFSASTAWNGGGNCSASTATVNAPVTASVALNGFQVSVRCWSRRFFEGQNPDGTGIEVRVFQITAYACPAAASTCPRLDSGAASASYVERRREAVGAR